MFQIFEKFFSRLFYAEILGFRNYDQFLQEFLRRSCWISFQDFFQRYACYCSRELLWDFSENPFAFLQEIFVGFLPGLILGSLFFREFFSGYTSDVIAQCLLELSSEFLLNDIPRFLLMILSEFLQVLFPAFLREFWNLLFLEFLLEFLPGFLLKFLTGFLQEFPLLFIQKISVRLLLELRPGFLQEFFPGYYLKVLAEFFLEDSFLHYSRGTSQSFSRFIQDPLSSFFFRYLRISIWNLCRSFCWLYSVFPGYFTEFLKEFF